jgi:hypothetical protein
MNNELNTSIEFERLCGNIVKLPHDILSKIIPYTYNTQPHRLLTDIRNFHLTSRLLLQETCNNDKNIMMKKILSAYNIDILYENIHPVIYENIKKWKNKNKELSIIDEFTYIHYPNEFELFKNNTKWIFLWGGLNPRYRNIYTNFLYSNHSE